MTATPDGVDNANGCHLHFELWSPPGWYAGGAATDPLPDVKAWEVQDPAHEHLSGLARPARRTRCVPSVPRRSAF